MRQIVIGTAARWLLAIILLWHGRAVAQQNLFNVPAATITSKGDFFFQQQLNLNASGQSNTTIDYGISKDFEIGLNILDVPIYSDAGPFTGSSNDLSDVLFNLQRGMLVTDNVRMGFGGQMGVSQGNALGRMDYVNFSWLSVRYTAPGDRGWYNVGVYYGNPAYLGPNDSNGLMLGLEYPIVPEKLHFMADWLTGNNDIAVAVVGGVLILPSDWQLSAGYQIPSPGSDNASGLVLEFTKFSWGAGGKPRRKISQPEVYDAYCP